MGFVSLLGHADDRYHEADPGLVPEPSTPDGPEQWRWDLMLGNHVVARITEVPGTRDEMRRGLLVGSPEFERYRLWFPPYADLDARDDAVLGPLCAEVRARGGFRLWDRKHRVFISPKRINVRGTEVWFRATGG